MNAMLLRLMCAGVSLTLLLTGSAKRSVETNRSFTMTNGQPANVRTSADVVQVETSPMPILIGSGEANVVLSVSPGYHVNANPATFPYLIATEATPGNWDGFSAGKPIYPTAQKKKFQFADSPLDVYEGDAAIRLPLQAASGVASGARALPIDVKVQACDNEQCFPPSTLHASISLDVK